MSNFFQQQQAARTRTSLLLALYLSSIIAIAASTYLLVLLAGSQSGMFQQSGLWQPELFLLCVLGTLALVVLGSLYKFAQLSSGAGASIAQELGGALISPDTTDPASKRLLNIVEEMALAAGMAVPPVYLLSEEQSINAFAAGSSPSQAVVAVTQGTLTKLSRDELQGVIAHEFSHILNGDMRLNLRIVAVLHGLLLLSLLGRGMLQLTSHSSRRRRYSYSSSSSSSQKENNSAAALAIFGIGLLVLGAIGVLFGRLIKSAVSRQREFLADASAVQFTRNPLGISGALKKIGGLLEGSRLQSAKAEEASHMFFANGMTSFFSSLFATHPPILERIERIEGRRFSQAQLAEFAEAQSAQQPEAELSPIGLAETQAQLSAFDAASSRAAFQHIGQLSSAAISQAQQLLSTLPIAVQQAARSPQAAQELLLELVHLQSSDANSSDAASGQGSNHFGGLLAALAPGHALPLLGLCLPALSQLDKEQRIAFLVRMRDAIQSDGTVSLFEYALFWSLRSRLQAPSEGIKLGLTESSFRELASQLVGVFGALTEQPSESPALQAAYTVLEVKPEQAPTMTPHELLEALEKLLLELRECAPLQKEKLTGACSALVLYDQNTSEKELLVLRALHAALDCPVPLAGYA